MRDTLNDIVDPGDQVRAAADRATRWLLTNHLKFLGELDRACFSEKGEIKLGANGLGLLAILSDDSGRNRDIIQAIADRLGNYILTEQRPDGDFAHKRDLATGTELPFRSQYYTGEALFGLLRLHEITGQWEWLKAAGDCEALLAGINYGVAEHSHWMLYAIDLLTKFRPNATFFEHATTIAAEIIDNPRYREDGRSTPIACRTEGLLAYLRTQNRFDSLKNDALTERCLAEIRQNLILQVKYRRQDGSFIRGGSDSRETEVRIDYIQHNISAFLGYHRFGGADEFDVEP